MIGTKPTTFFLIPTPIRIETDTSDLLSNKKATQLRGSELYLNKYLPSVEK